MPKRKLKFGDIVRVDWRDAAGYGGWMALDELKVDGAMITATVGHFVGQSKYGIYTAALMNQNQRLNDVSFVPRGMILKTTFVSRPKQLPRPKGEK